MFKNLHLCDLSERARTRLVEAGWTPDRDVSIDESVRDLVRSGWKVHDAAKDFLKSFSGLTVTVGKERTGRAFFSASKATEGLEPWHILLLQKLTDKEVCPVAWRAFNIILITNDLRLIFVRDDWTMFLEAPNVAAGLDLLLFPGSHPYEIKDIPDDLFDAEDA